LILRGFPDGPLVVFLYKQLEKNESKIEKSRKDARARCFRGKFVVFGEMASYFSL